MAEGEMGVAEKGEGNGVSSSKTVGKSKEEKKRRLILSDSDSDDCLASVRKAGCGTAQDGDSSSIDRSYGVELMKEEKVEVEKKRRKVLRSDVVKPTDELLVVNKKEVIYPNLERKRIREPAVAEVPAKKLKMDLPEQGERKKSVTCERKSKSDSLHHGDDRKKTKVNEDAVSKPLVPASREGDGVMENQIQSKSQKTSKTQTEEVKLIEQSGNQTLWMKDSISSLTADKRVDTGISQCKGGVLRVQGKSGVLRVLLNNKVDGPENLHAKRRDEKESKTLGSPRIATRGMSKQLTLSADRRVHEKSSSTFSTNESRKVKTDIVEKSRSNKPKTEAKVISPKKEKKRANVEKNRNDFKVKSSSSSKSPKKEKKRVNVETNRTDFKVKSSSSSKSDFVAKEQSDKQKLRGQIKSILINAGWTIDLRPRKERNYVDSVYIPPDGRGSYWSITKAYAVYQEQLNSTCNERRKNSSGRSSGTTSGSDCIIPMESLNILKRIVVNKRSRRKEELEEAGRGTKKKVKKSFDLRHPREQEIKDKLDKIGSRKMSNIALASNTKCAVGSISHKHLQTGRNKQRGCALLARGSKQKAEAEDNDYVPYVWKRTVLSWMIDMGVLPINGKVNYMNQRKTKTKLEGRITRDGIHCSCCSKILTVSKFELHAGSKLLQPSQNIFLEDGGVSLFQCQLDAWKRQDESERQGFYMVDVSGDDPNDDTCGICGDGGDLICCDGCPSTFHLSCLDIEMLPAGDWHCTNCCCRFCGEIPTDATRESDGTISSLLSCNQCEAKYHQDCTPEAESVSASSKSLGISFCAQSCRKVFKQLQKILGTKNDLEAGFSWSIIRRFDGDASKSPLRSHQMAECNSKIAVALAVMDECFLPIVDQRSGVNLIPNVVYNCGSNFNRLNYRGFYTFILERGDEIISVASIRIHGTRLAEMPFIGTRNMYRRQGMCRRLLDGIESALCSLNVERLVIPAISELKDTWTNVFGFKPLEVSQELEVRSINILVFPGTGLLQKPLLKIYSSEQHTPPNGVGTIEYDIKHQHQAKLIHESSQPSTIKPNLDASGQAVVHCVYVIPSPESAHDSNHDVEDQVPVFQSSSKTFDDDSRCHSSEVPDGHMYNMANKSLRDHLEPSIHAVNEEMMHRIHNVKPKDAVLDPKSFANGEDSEPFAFEIVSRPLDVGSGKESRTSYSSGAAPDSDRNARFSIQQGILDGVHVTSGTVCKSNLPCVAKSCKIPGENEHSDMASFLRYGQ